MQDYEGALVTARALLDELKALHGQTSRIVREIDAQLTPLKCVPPADMRTGTPANGVGPALR
jgi:hypothetical protein